MSTYSEREYSWLTHLPIDATHKNIIANAIVSTRKKEYIEITRPHYAKLLAMIDTITHYPQLLSCEMHIDDAGTVALTHAHPNTHDTIKNDSSMEHISSIVNMLIPWRKGPFNIFGIPINAEWNSTLKWQRLQTICDIDMLCNNNTIIDIGCNNLYYSFNMLKNGASMVLGIDPVPRYSLYYKFFSTLLQDTLPLYFEFWGSDDIIILKKCFDVAFLMGILYHQRNPLSCLETTRQCLTKGGLLVVDTICLSSMDDYCLFPQSRYQKSKGYWFIPSVGALQSWLKRSGFEILAIGDPIKTTTQEQQHTIWGGGESLSHFLDPQDDSKTAEGYLAPYRILVVARRVW